MGQTDSVSRVARHKNTLTPIERPPGAVLSLLNRSIPPSPKIDCLFGSSLIGSASGRFSPEQEDKINPEVSRTLQQYILKHFILEPIGL
jgi:hypothetical protein